MRVSGTAKTKLLKTELLKDIAHARLCYGCLSKKQTSICGQ